MYKIMKLIEETNIAKTNLENAEYGDDLDENGNDVGMYFLMKANELSQTHDMEALFVLFDYFERKFDVRFDGVLERIQNDIVTNFTLKQILDVFYEKFDQLIKKNTYRASYMTFWFLNNDMFEDFRKMFNTVKSNASEKFLDELDDWSDDDYTEERKILREDMKKW